LRSTYLSAAIGAPSTKPAGKHPVERKLELTTTPLQRA